MQLKKDDLLSLEAYSTQRDDFRRKAMAEKKIRVIPVGPDVTMHFENRFLVQYQVQEMLRIEKIFEADEIEEELATYNPMVPDGSNWKVTQMIEYSDPDIRKVELARLVGIDRKSWVQVGDHERVYAISDEDLERETEDKTSSVHFMRFELNGEMVADAKGGAPIKVGIDHENYQHETVLGDEPRKSLVADLA
ncbi:MAG TPA: DUF3501 family protein [Gammaproteobacteria bacterium]|nr:DUF3501 family protein [Gammaproteobacteria bacterium]